MIIRPYKESDYPALQNICLVTAPAKKTEKARLALYNMYLDYYVLYSSEYCFVAADEFDTAVGYVICASNNEKYEKEYREHMLKALKKLSFFGYITKLFELKYSRRVAKAYPAHLHIDILPRVQRMGLGHKLIDALIEKLKQDKVDGVFLLVGASNKKGVSFYEKYGFKEYKRTKSLITFTLDLKK